MVCENEKRAALEKGDYHIAAARNQLAWTMEKDVWREQEWQTLRTADELLQQAQTMLGQMNLS
jgi:hypothetical protein